MAPLEVAAAGRPTIAYRAGGAQETVVENITGTFFNEQTPDALGDALEAFEKLDFSPSALRKHAENFSVGVFQDRFRTFLARIGAPLESQPFVPAPAADLSTWAGASAND